MDSYLRKIMLWLLAADLATAELSSFQGFEVLEPLGPSFWPAFRKDY